ncbi:MAG: RidA family protein [Bacteroidota bacterium]
MKEIIRTTDAPAPIGPYNQAIKVNGTLYVSGTVGFVPGTGKLIEGSVADEAHQVMKNVGAVLKAAGMTYAHIVKTSIFLKDMNDFAEVNGVYGSYFETDFPARETVQVARLPADVNVEISVIAVE